MAGKCLLFVYGLLKPGLQPPKSISQSFPDRIGGLLYDLGEYPAAVNAGHGSSEITGFTIEIDEDELEAIDEFEDVDAGMYRRIMIETRSGYFAWVYEYLLEIPEGTPLVTDWMPKA